MSLFIISFSLKSTLIVKTADIDKELVFGEKVVRGGVSKNVSGGGRKKVRGGGSESLFVNYLSMAGVYLQIRVGAKNFIFMCLYCVC